MGRLALVVVTGCFAMACTWVDPIDDLSRGGGSRDAAGDGVQGDSGPGPTLIDAGSFLIDSTEVTIGQYGEFLAAGVAPGGPPPCDWNTTFQPTQALPASPDKPVVYVDWCDAYAFCAWAGKRLCGAVAGGGVAPESRNLPTIDQWFAACSHDGDLAFPYGNAYDPSACNGPDYGAGAALDVGSLSTCEGGFPGLHDMSGNVEEWESSCSANSGASDDCSTRSGSYHDSQLDGGRLQCDAGHTEKRNASDFDIGFRCCSAP